MFALTYYSKAISAFDDERLYKLSAKARDKNRKLQVTGFLQYKDGYFLQYLEGTKSTVEDLMAAIAQDKRHTVLRTVYLAERDSRRFDNWHMRYWKESEFKHLKLADLLQDALRVIDPAHFGDKYLEERVTRLVDRMSEHQGQINELIQTKK
uniref:BLUF domain-containing protein n=1 Tax=Roseihalotalea indica TaxID=2867963 RepID=A0AA49JFL0_9BACT|nr:BLUF domain-containing protein [Tunicatimonas sp. TK19036]